MLELRSIRKSYTVADFTQVALDDVSIAFRDSEFVAVLGPSGSGKTTMLNIVGGLDHYDSGDLIIDGVSTRKFRDRDWDTYRNNRIGFVFQSYNLIPHQTVLANVELALTLSGVSRSERRDRATRALAQVGLADHVHKLPSQLSGGQMQRVAIARALVNDPEIVLADEPTGALDSTTSVQILDLLTEIARDRLVVMVTHNPDLAARYATRTVTLRDGAVRADSDPYDPDSEAHKAAKPARRTSMSFLTALSLSFTNLMTKKGRTLMTSFAGSIGIIGIAAILALASGVNAYIQDVEEDTLTVYPLSVYSQGMDMTALLAASSEAVGDDQGDQDDAESGGSADDGTIEEVSTLGRMATSTSSNDLRSLKAFLDSGGDGIDGYANSIEYLYDVTPQIYLPDTADGVHQVNPDNSFAPLGFGATQDASPLMSTFTTTSVFDQLMSDTSLVRQQYEVVAGDWPTGAEEALLVLMPGGTVTDYMLYSMGLRDPDELASMVERLAEGQDVAPPAASGRYSSEELMDVTFKVVDATTYYVRDQTYGVWTDKRGDEDYMAEAVGQGMDLRISGIVRPADGATATALRPGVYYTPALQSQLISQAARTPIVRQQVENPSIDVFTGRSFGDLTSGEGQDDLDLSTLIAVDQDRLMDAFTVDQSRLTLDVSALDLSGLDLSGLQGAGLDLSGLDLSGIRIDASALPQLDLEQLVADVDISDLLSGVDLGEVLTGIDYQQIVDDVVQGIDGDAAAAVARDLADGFLAYCAADGGGGAPGEDPGDPDEGADPARCADVAAAFDEFLQTPEGQQILSEGRATLEDAMSALEDARDDLTDQVMARLTEAVQDQIAAHADELQAQIRQVMDQYVQQATQAYVAQLSTQVADQIGTQIQAQIGAQVSQVSQSIAGSLQTQVTAALQQAMGDLASSMSQAMDIDEDAFADAFSLSMDPEDLTDLLVSMASDRQASLAGNYATLGYAEEDSPFQIDIYPADFEAKEHILTILDDYNAQMRESGQEDKVITYTDVVGTLMSSVTRIVDVVTYVLTAFVAISLVVSSIMIGVITYISVLERKKEIGILRSIGASRRDIRTVFNAETLIVGFVAGMIGIVVTLLLTLPANAIIHARFGIANVAQLPWLAAVALVAISMALTVIAGLFPSSAASRRDPVEALRSE